MLALSNNGIGEIPDGFFAATTSLKELDMSRNKLVGFPNDLGCLKQVRMKRSSFFCFWFFYPQKKLVKLNVSFNEIRRIPLSICSLLDLEQLNIEHNCVEVRAVLCFVLLFKPM